MIKIIGAGMAGLLAANMLKEQDTPKVYERQSALPNNHSAVLRFRTSKVGDVLGIPFRKVVMVKARAHWANPVADALAYSFKCTGQYRSDRSISRKKKTLTEDRYIAPPNLIQRMAAQLPEDAIHYNFDYKFHADNDNKEPIISTIPMPVLMAALGYNKQPKFSYQKGRNIRAKIEDCDAYVSLEIPDPSSPITRLSITGDEIIIECIEHHPTQNSTTAILSHASRLLGIPEDKFHDPSTYRQAYQKIIPIDDETRKAFMFYATDNFGIFSLGRFATWRPTLLADDLVQDIRKIAGWINNHYEMLKSRN